MYKRHVLLMAAIIGLTIFPVATRAEKPFYEDKMISVIVGYSPGGGYDTYARSIARHMGKHTPGHPTIIVYNMPGAGSLIAANHLYRVAKPDGLTIGHFNGLLILSQALGQPGIEFDARKFEYIGVPVIDEMVCICTKASGITSIEKWMNSKVPVKFGGMAPGTGSTDNGPRVLKAALGLPIKVISGYKGTAEIRLAMESGELNGICGNWAIYKPIWRKALEIGDVVVVLQAVPKPLPDLPNIPLAINLAKTDEARQLIEVGIHNNDVYARPFVLPPGTPKEAVQILRKAFQETMKDKEFLIEMEKAAFKVNPASVENVEEIIVKIFKLDPAMLAVLKETLYNKW